MFPELATERFLLRQIRRGDQQQIFEGLSHPEVIRYYGVSYATFEETKVQMDFYDDLLARETGIWWGIAHRTDPSKLIGACGFNDWKKEHRKIEIGYWLMPLHMGRGVMSACLPLILDYAFTRMHIHRIEAFVEVENKQSLALLQRVGFNYEGLLKDVELKNSKYISLTAYALIR